jgi:hypothetical protein
MTGRDINSAATAVIVGGKLASAVFVEMLLDTPIYFSNANVSIDYGGHTWLGVQQLQVESITEGAQQAEQMRFTLPAVPNEYLALALSTNIRGKSVSVYLGILDPDSHAVLQMVPLWGGQLDQMPIGYGPDNAAISVTAEHRAVAYARPKPLRYTDADQRRLYPGDRCLEFLINQSQKEDTWPSAAWFRR